MQARKPSFGAVEQERTYTDTDWDTMNETQQKSQLERVLNPKSQCSFVFSGDEVGELLTQTLLTDIDEATMKKMGKPLAGYTQTVIENIENFGVEREIKGRYIPVVVVYLHITDEEQHHHKHTFDKDKFQEFVQSKIKEDLEIDSLMGETVYGAANKLREGGGCVWLELPRGTKREVRKEISEMGSLLYDSDNQRPDDLPKTKEDIEAMLSSLSPDEVLVFLGSNPTTMEAELAAAVVRGETDWDFLRKGLYPKILVKTRFNAVRWKIPQKDIKGN